MNTRHAQALLFLEGLSGNPPQLPFEPTLLPALFKATSSDATASMDTVANLVNKSQGLAAEVLRLANSAYYGLGTAVSSLTRAMTVLGMNEVRNMVLALGAASSLKKFPMPPTFSVQALWEHQLLTASIARELGSIVQDSLPGKNKDIGPDELYAAGLLHDLGKILLASRCPDDWSDIISLSKQKNIPFFMAEDEHWGVDHCVAGARLLAFWQLPPQLTEPVSWHHAPKLADEEFRLGATLLSIADAMANAGIQKKAQKVEKFTEQDIPKDAWDMLPETLDKKTLLLRLHKLLSANAASNKASALIG